MRRELVVSITLIGSVAAAWAEDVKDVETAEDLLHELANRGAAHASRFAFSNDEVHSNGSGRSPFDAEPVAAIKQAALVERGVVPDALPRSIAGAEAAVKVFEASIGDPKALAATVSDREEVALFGSAAGERAEEGAQVKARLLAWKLAFKVRDGIRAGVTASKNVAWVAANVDATSIKRPKDPPRPYRVLAVYEKTPAAWKLVQLSFSVDPRTDVKRTDVKKQR